MSGTVNLAGIRVERLKLLGAASVGKTYDISFIDATSEEFKALSIIAGPSQTGKTSIIEFILYCLGDKEHPQHPEMIANVRAAMLGTVLDSEITTVERDATGPASKFASVWRAPFEGIRSTPPVRLAVDPSSDPDSLSQYVLAACGLNSVELPEAPTQEESSSHVLSIRDLFRLMWVPNERLDNKNLLLEHGNFMVRQKLYQTIDAMFGVHDAEGTELATRARAVGDAAREAQKVANSLKAVVQQEYPQGGLVLETDKQHAEQEAGRLREMIRNMDANQRSRESAVGDLRQRLEVAQRAAREALLRVRNRESLMDRLSALRGQYADDRKKLTFLKEAEKLFNPLKVTACPACLSTLESSPALDQSGQCTLCSTQVVDQPSDLTLGSMVTNGASQGASDVLTAELRATTRRLDDLNDYWKRLDEDLKLLHHKAAEANDEVTSVAASLNGIADLPAPYLAGRDNLNQRLSDALLRLQNADAGLRFWVQVRAAEAKSERLSGQAALLRKERREIENRPDRASVYRKLSDRFGKILSDIGYPKLSEPLLDKKLVPHVRGLPYTNASSGGLVLISLAWHLALWEVAYEEGANAPGLLMIDSPQKNLGHSARPGDPDFADTRLVENFYRHAREWLANSGKGAQLVVVDNSPPLLAEDDVVVRFTRDRERHPYGLIHDAVD